MAEQGSRVDGVVELGRTGDSVGCRWGMLSNASRSIDLMSERVIQLIRTIVLRPAFPAHLPVNVVDCSVKEIQVSLHHTSRVPSGIPKIALPLLEPGHLDLILKVV